MTGRAIDAAKPSPHPKPQSLSKKPARRKPTQKPTARNRNHRYPRPFHARPVLLQHSLVGEANHRTLRLDPPHRPPPIARRSDQRPHRQIPQRLHSAGPHVNHARPPCPAPSRLRRAVHRAQATQNSCAPAPQRHGVGQRTHRHPCRRAAASPLLDPPLLRPRPPLRHSRANQPRKLRRRNPPPHLHHEKRCAPDPPCNRRPRSAPRHPRPQAGCALRGATRTARKAAGQRAPRCLPPSAGKRRHQSQTHPSRPSPHNGNKGLRPHARPASRASSARSR
jgi:hypothetical protein